MDLDITRRQKKLSERDTPSSLFSILAYDKDSKSYFHEDGFISFILMCQPISGINDGIIHQLQVITALDYPADSIMQIGLWTCPDLELQLLNMNRIRKESSNKYQGPGRDIARQLSKRRAEYLREHTKVPLAGSTGTKIRDNVVFITVKIPVNNIPDERNIDSLDRLRITLEQSLITLGMAPYLLDPEEYIRFVGSMVNWDDNASWRSQAKLYDEKELIKNQIFDAESGIQVKEDSLIIGKKHVKTLSVKRYPEYVHLSQAMEYLGDFSTGQRGIRENVLITMNIIFPETEEMKTILGTKKNAAVWQSMGQLAKYVPKLKAKKDSFDALFEAFEDGDRPVRAFLSFAIFDDNKDKVIASTSNMITYYRELGFRLQEDRYITLPIFLNSLPLCSDLQSEKNLMRYKTMGGRHAVNMMPVLGDWKGTRTPVFMMHSRTGQLMSYDLFDSQTNYSAIVAAESGSGKSFFINALMNEYIALGAQVFVIDVGKSFKNTCKILQGDHIEFTPKSNISLNPFTNIENYAEQADLLQAVLVAMISPKGEIDEFQLSVLLKIVTELWAEKGKELSIDILEEKLLSWRDADGNVDSRVTDMGTQLFSFTTKGVFGKWFNRPATINFQSSLTVCELLELKDRKHLQKVVLVQLISAIQRAMYLGDKDRMKILIIDEGFDLITEGAEGKFIERGVRQLRKHEGGAITILQSVNDLYKTETGVAIAENTATKFLLGQTPEAIDGMMKSKRLSFDEGVANILKTVRTKKGEYSEIFIHNRDGHGIGRLAVDRYSQLMFSTDVREKSALKKRLDAGMSVENAIASVISEEKLLSKKAS